MRLRTLILAVAALAAVPASASADSLVAPAPGGVNLAAGGGYHVWVAPGEDIGWRLVVRAPDGTVSRPDVDAFTGPPQVSIGSDRFAAGGRRLLAVYSRAGDLYAYDLRRGTEERLRGISSRTYQESSPAIQFGRMVFVRRGGKRPGVYYLSRPGDTRRLTRDTPRDLSFNGTRVAYDGGRSVVVRRVSGDGRALVFRTRTTPRSPQLTRYRVAWLESGGRILQTPRFAGSGGPYDVDTAGEATRALPASTQSIAFRGGELGWYLDGEGLTSIEPRLTFGSSG
jgi:hypothetical protein